MMFELVVIVLKLVGIIAVHELGHWLGYWAFGLRPDLKFRNGMVIIGENCYKKLELWQYYVVSISGIFLGLVMVLLIDGSESWVLTYFLMCMVDIVNILNCLEVKQKYGKGVNGLSLDTIMYLQSLQVVSEYEKGQGWKT